MMTIYKYPLALVDRQVILLPTDAQILCVQVQDGVACLWALVTPEGLTQKRDIRMHGTGHPLPLGAGSYRYIDTIQFHGGSLVFHVFEAP